MFHSLLLVGDAYARGALLGGAGVRAAWRMLMPEDAVRWFAAQPWTEAALARLGARWGEVWWRYLRAFCGLQPRDAGGACPASSASSASSALSARDVVCVVEAGHAQLLACARTRSAFAAVLLQLALTERHDQSLCSLRGDPSRPPFYDQYVDRSHTGSLFSLRTLLQCEDRYTCARRAVDKFRGVQGRLVAEILDDSGAEFIRRPRSRVKRFTCAKCARRRYPPPCRRCTRLQSDHPRALLAYWGHTRAWVPVPDAHTVCGDVAFVCARSVPVGARVVHAGAHWTLAKKARRRDDDPEIVLHLTPEDPKDPKDPEDPEDPGRAPVVLCRGPKSVLAVLPERLDCFEMLRDDARVVHGMRTSVNLDTAWRRRSGTRKGGQYATTPLRVASPAAGAPVWGYAVWRSLVAVCAAVSDPPTRATLQTASRAHILRTQSPVAAV